MILIIGGMGQGKGKLAEKLAGRSPREFAANRADGETDPLKLALEKPFLTGFHGWIRQLTEKGEEPDAFVSQVLEAGPEIITMDEVGCGIVPLEKKERIYREAVGQAGQQLARRADQVYRVVCGISERIQ